MEATKNYKIEIKKGGAFQLWTLTDREIDSKGTLVLLFGFYGATEKAIARYCEIYLARGLPVLYIPSQLLHFALPSHAVKLGQDLMHYLDHEAADYSYYFVHTFSMGSFNFAVCNYEVMSKHQKKYDHIKKKIKAIIYDSVTVGSAERMMKGIGMGMVRNRILQAVIPKLMSVYFYLMKDTTIKQFEHWIEMFRTEPIQVPTLYFFCENDPISDYKYIHEMIEGFRKMATFPVIEQCWQKSRHGIHLMIHTEDYMDCVDRLFQSVPELELHRHSNLKSKM